MSYKIIASQMKNIPHSVQSLLKNFHVVHKTCDINDARVICLLNFHSRYDSIIMIQKLIDQMAKDDDIVLVESRPNNQLTIQDSDPDTHLIKKNVIVKGWDEPKEDYHLTYFSSNSSSLLKRLNYYHTDLRKDPHFERRLATYQSLSNYKNSHPKVPSILKQLENNEHQENHWLLRKRNKYLLKTIKHHASSKRRVFVIMGAAHYDSTNQYFQDYLSKNYKNDISKKEYEQFIKKSSDLAKPFRDDLQKMDSLVLFPKDVKDLPIQGTNLTEKEIRKALFQACKLEHLVSVQNLLSIYPGAFSQIKDKSVHLMHIAAQIDDPDILSLLLEKKAGIHVRDEEGATPLHTAAYFGKVDQLDLLIKQGARVNELNKSLFTPLALSLRRGHYDSKKVIQIVDTLLQAKADPNISNEGDLAPLHLAIIRKHDVKIVELLLKHKADPNVLTGDLKETPLSLALYYKRDKATIQNLLKAGADPNLGFGKISPLELTIRKESIDVIPILLKHGADPLINNGDLLLLAVETSSLETIKTLLNSLQPDKIPTSLGKQIQQSANERKDPKIASFINTFNFG